MLLTLAVTSVQRLCTLIVSSCTTCIAVVAQEAKQRRSLPPFSLLRFVVLPGPIVALEALLTGIP